MRERERGVPRQSENRDRIRQRDTQRQSQAERHTETKTERFTTFFCCDCTSVYPGLLLAIPSIAQATSSLDKNF